MAISTRLAWPSANYVTQIEMIDPARILANHPLFSVLEEVQLISLANLAKTLSVSEGNVIFLKDDPGNGLYGILKGRVDITSVSEAGREVIVVSLRKGDVFGEISLFDKKGRSANAVARGNSDLFFISQKNFEAFVHANPDLLMRFVGLLCERLRRTTQSLEDAVFLDVGTRLAKCLVAEAASVSSTYGALQVVEINITQSELAQQVGASREIVNRLLQTWKRDHVLTLRRNAVIVLSLERLERLTDPKTPRDGS